MYKNNFQAFVFASQPFRRRIAVMWLFIIVGNVFAYSVPYFFKRMADLALVHSALTLWDLRFILAGILICLLGQEFSYRLGHFLETRIVPGVYDRITTDLYYRLLRYPTTWFENRFAGSLGNRVEQIGTSVKFIFEELVWVIGWQVIAMAVNLVLLCIAHQWIGFVFSLWLVVFITSSFFLLRWQYKETEKLAEVQSSLVGNIVDAVGNVTLVHSFAAEQQEHKQHRRHMKQVLVHEHRERMVVLWNKMHQGMSIVVLTAALAVISAWLFSRQAIAVGDFILVVAAVPVFVSVIWNFGDIVVRTMRNLGTMQSALTALTAVDPVAVVGTKRLATKKSSITFSQVRFVYPETIDPVFNNFSLHIPPGQKTGIVGMSGAGKSTLIKLLLRQYVPQKGTINIGEQDIIQVKLSSLRQSVALVPQDTTLFHRTLFDNIRYARPTASRAQVLAASKKAYAHEFIERMPQGYDTLVGERGVKLSGGQRQRIAIARAMLKNAPILILDEATSALDSESERVVQEGLHELFKNRTVIAIAHRLSTLREMDHVVVLNKGKVVEEGSPGKLLAEKDGHFKAIWEQQKASFVT